jgi:nicotinamide phosphoribosyltransferase
MSNLLQRIEELAKKASLDSLSPEFMDIAARIRVLENSHSELMDLDEWQNNIILSTDAYKCCHYEIYPEGSEYVYSYIESRGSDRKWKKAQFFGLHAFKKRYLKKPITQRQIDFAEKIITGMGLPFNRQGWEYILRVHNGYLPLKIKAVREGTVLNTRNVLVTVVNTDPNCYWLTNYIEIAILEAFIESSDEDVRPLISSLSFKLNDFGARGVSSKESGEIGGMAHLINFRGSDNIEAVVTAIKRYGAVAPGGSVCAAEHSTITTYGRNRESLAYANILAKFAKPGSIVAVVSDSYDLFHAIREIWGKELKQKVIDSQATIVIRPDSGDPLTIPVEVVKLLAEIFGYTVNSKGFKVLPNCVRVIQGDGITEETLPIILRNLMDAGFSVDNIVFGMGGGLLQLVNRDMLKFAMKCSAISINGVWYNVRKEPITDPNKRSKAGRFVLVLVESDGETDGLAEYVTVPFEGHEELDMLVTGYEDGEHYNDPAWDDIVLISHTAALAMVGLK